MLKTLFLAVSCILMICLILDNYIIPLIKRLHGNYTLRNTIDKESVEAVEEPPVENLMDAFKSNDDDYDKKIRAIEKELATRQYRAEVLDSRVRNLPHDTIDLKEELYPSVEESMEKGHIEVSK